MLVRGLWYISSDPPTIDGYLQEFVLSSSNGTSAYTIYFAGKMQARGRGIITLVPPPRMPLSAYLPSKLGSDSRGTGFVELM